jgi:tetratricopeptide (TPR) repeat protein
MTHRVLPILALLLLAPACRRADQAASAATEPDRAELGKEKLAAGRKLLEAHDPQGALRELGLAVEYAPDSAEAHYALGVAYFELDEHGRARGELEAALDKSARHAGALEYLGRIEYAENRLREAIERWKAALEIDPDRASVRALLEKAEREVPVEDRFTEQFTQHFRLKLEGGAVGAAIAKRVGEALEQAYSDVGYKLGHYPSRTIPVLLYGDREFYAVTGAHGWVGGLFDGKIRIPLKDASGRETALGRVATHEYVHACVYTLAPRCPTWLQEGLAQHFEGERQDPAQVAQAASLGTLPTFASLATEFTSIREVRQVRLIYGESVAFVEYLIARGGEGQMAALLGELGEGRTIDEGMLKVYGAKLEELEAGWRGTLAR